ncbi:MAG: methyltransferase domain-containing protein [Acidimicrobiales bacterium]
MPAPPSNHDLGKSELVKSELAARWFPGRNLVTTLRYRGRDFRYRALFDVLRQHCRGRVLDVGGGAFVTTAIEERVPFSEWTIVEPYEADLPTLTDSRVRTMVGDGHALEIEGNQFDTVLSIQVLEHVFEPIRMIEELYRVTTPGGHLVVMVPQTANLHHLPHHYQNFTRYWLEAAAHRLGADVVEYHALGGAWSTIASRVLLQYPGVFGIAGYQQPGIRRGWRFWALFPVGLMVSAVVFPLSMLMSLGDMKEEANNHVMVLRKPLQ